jgi:hypothetical protein
MPAKAGIQNAGRLDSRLRGSDVLVVKRRIGREATPRRSDDVPGMDGDRMDRNGRDILPWTF